jgi:cardiolipin synthase
MGLIPLFVIFITRGDAGKALAVFGLAGLTDALDGFIARFWRQQTLLGAYLDPAADKLLLTTAYVTLSIEAINPELTIPLWVTILVIARDVLIVTTVVSLHLALGIKTFRPAAVSKITTALQVAAVVALLVYLVRPSFPALDELAIGLVYAVAVFTVASGLNYIYLTNRMVAGHRDGASPG